MSLASSRKHLFSISSALAVSLLASPAALMHAQTVTATLQGTVMDTGGAAVPAAKVSIRNTATDATRVITADASGRFTAPNLQPGPYTLLVEATGFSSKTFNNITLSVGDVQTLNPTIDVGAVSETVNVSGAEDLIQTSTSSNATLVDDKQVVELPLLNRQFYNLVLLSPAAYQPAQNSTLGFRGGINIAGATEISNQFTYNGIFNNDLGVGAPSYRPSVETIQEFRLLTGVYPAEYGRLSGGQVVIISKSGTNKFHGDAYEFLRNQVTDAKPFFTQTGVKNPAFKQNTFGGTVGGPIWRDRTFFFFGYEGQRIRSAVTALAQVPTTQQLSGVFQVGTKNAAGQIVPETIYDPTTGQPLPLVPGTGGTTGVAPAYNLASIPTTEAVNYTSVGAVAGQTIAKLGFPAPTTPTQIGLTPASNYTFQETRSENMNEFTIRGDHKLSNKDQISASYNIFRDPAFEPSNSLCSSYVLPNFGCFTNQVSTLIGVNYDRIITPNIVNNLRLGYQRLNQPRVQQDNTSIGAAYPGLPGGPYFNQPGYANNLGLPNVTFGQGYSTVGGATNLPQVRYDNHYQVADSATWSHGAHTFKGGVDLLLARSVNVITSSGRGAFSVNDGNIQSTNANHLGSTGDSIADLLLGLSYTSTVGTTAGTVYLNFQGYDAFFQDDWKIRPNLTLNLGVRYEVDAPVYSPNNTISNFNQSPVLSQQQFIPAGVNGNFNHLYNYDYNNIAPRLGFSWQPYHDERTVIKGGVGEFFNQPLLYNEFLGNGTQAPFRIVPTFTTTPSQVGTVNTINLATPFSVPNAKFSILPCVNGAQTVAVSPTAANPAGSPGCSASLSPLSVQSRYATPELMEWSLGVQQSLSRSIVFETTYFGSKGTKLPQNIFVNVINPATNPFTKGSQGARPDPAFSNVTSTDTRSNSEFHSWQNSLKQTYHNGVTFILAYTFAKSIDGSGGVGSGSNSSSTAQNPFNLRADRGLSDFDVRHRVVFSPVAELPFGRGKAYLNHGVNAAIFGNFQISSIFQFQTGRPFTITDSSSNTSTFFGNNDRPDAIGNPNSRMNSVTGAPTHTVAQWFNTSAFALNSSNVASRYPEPLRQHRTQHRHRSAIHQPRPHAGKEFPYPRAGHGPVSRGVLRPSQPSELLQPAWPAEHSSAPPASANHPGQRPAPLLSSRCVSCSNPITPLSCMSATGANSLGQSGRSPKLRPLPVCQAKKPCAPFNQPNFAMSAGAHELRPFHVGPQSSVLSIPQGSASLPPPYLRGLRQTSRGNRSRSPIERSRPFTSSAGSTYRRRPAYRPRSQPLSTSPHARSCRPSTPPTFPPRPARTSCPRLPG